MAVYREHSISGLWGKFLRYFSLLVIIFFVASELENIWYGFFNPGMWCFYLAMFALWQWRMGFNYVYSFDGKSIIVERRSFFFKKVYKYEMSDIERIVVDFRRKFFQRERFSKYRSLFSDADANHIHLLIVTENGKNTGVMIKSTDNFFKRMKKVYADKFANSNW